MATQTKHIPILMGKDAERFIDMMNNPKKIPEWRLVEMRKNYESIKSKCRF